MCIHHSEQVIFHSCTVQMCVKYLAEYIRIMSERKFVVPLLSERKFNEINTLDYVKIYGEDSFAKLFSEYYGELRKLGLTEKKLGELTGLQPSTISLYINGKRTPSLYSLVALCIGMRLYYPRSMLLMKKARLSLDENSLKDRICMKYLIGCGFDTSIDVDSCNRELRENHLSELNQ